ncbi:MAG TPA: S1C family serine protease [Methylomirabilota bacterium]|jgi:S1-C subfamily serine protease
MARRLTQALAILSIGLGMVAAAPPPHDLRPHPSSIPAEPSFVKRVEPAIVGIRVRADESAFSSARLGSRRFASGVIFDTRGYALTVSYVLLDAMEIEVLTRDGRTVAGQLAGLDLETGLGIVRLDSEGPWPAARLGDSADASVGMLTGTVGVDEDNDLVYVTGSLRSIRRFSGFWEYMLKRALIVAPSSNSWGGSAVVDTGGSVIGIASLRLGEPPYVNVAIPMETFVPVKDELIAMGRVLSRRPRPWLGLYTSGSEHSVVVEGVASVGPSAGAGFRKGDRILSVNGVGVTTQEEFYEALWRGRAGDVIRVGVQREDRRHVIPVRSVDRYQLLRTPPR